MCGSILIWFFVFTSDWHAIWIVFLFIVNCYLIWATIQAGVVLHVILLCVTFTVLKCIFVHLLIVTVSHFVVCAFQSVLECHLQCLQ